MIFVFFSVFFRCRFSDVLRKAKKSPKLGQQDTESGNFGAGSSDPLAPGERQREGYKIFAWHNELGFPGSRSVISQDVSESDCRFHSACQWHTCGGRRIELPLRGGHCRPPTTSPIAAKTRKHRHWRQTSCGSARSRPLFACEWPNDAGQVGGKVFATRKWPHRRRQECIPTKRGCTSLPKRSQK